MNNKGTYIISGVELCPVTGPLLSTSIFGKARSIIEGLDGGPGIH